MKKWTNAKVIEMCISETSHPGPAGHGPAGPGAPGPGPAGPGPATPGPGPAGPGPATPGPGPVVPIQTPGDVIVTETIEELINQKS